MIFEDTSPAAQQFMIDGYKKMSPAKKLARVFDLSDSLRLLARQRIMKKYGSTISEREIRLKLASLYLDRSTMITVFDYDPETEGY